MLSPVNKSLPKINSKVLTVFFLLSIGLWVFSLRGYLSGAYLPQVDAAPYYGHVNFYTSQIARGTYPMWDPTRDMGVPNEFYLRRIGSFNPFYFLVVLLVKSGLKFSLAYPVFLAGYYLFGMFGFYKLAKFLWKDERIAFVAYLLLLFSSTATLLFSSFIILIITPMIWFFYFWLSFMDKPTRRDCLGFVFAIMLLVTTYVPFYFLLMLIAAIILWGLIYWKESQEALKKSWQFVKDNQVFTLLCVACLSFSLLPGILFYKEAARGEVVMNIRHKLSDSANILAVAQQNYIEGGILVNSLLNELTDNLKNYQLGQCYVPFAAHIFFLIGILATINRKIFFIGIFSFFFYLVGLYEATPLYAFLYKHVFFIKYMRNFQYFLWLVLLPCYLLLATEHFKQWISDDYKKRFVKYRNLIILLLVHAGMIIFLTRRDNSLLSSYILTGVSLIVFACFVCRDFLKLSHPAWKNIFFAVVFILITSQSVEVFSYLKKSARVRDPNVDDNPKLVLVLPNQQSLSRMANDQISREESHNQTWFSIKWIEVLKENVSAATVLKRFQHKLAAYDHLQLIDENDKVDYKKIEKALWDNDNMAFVFKDGKKADSDEQLKSFLTDSKEDEKAEIIAQDSKDVKILQFDVNKVKLETHFSAPKFLVYHDSYHKDWRAFLDKNQIPIYRSSIAFKGIAVPAGSHVIEFQFGYWWQQMLNCGLVFLYVIVFVRLLFYHKNEFEF